MNIDFIAPIMSIISGVIPSTTPTPKSAKLSSLAVTQGLELEGTFVNNAIQTTADAVSLHAARTTNQAIGPAGTPIQVIFPTVTAPAPSQYNNATGTYTAAVTGQYTVTANVVWAVSAVGTRILQLFVNGAAVNTVSQNALSAGSTFQSIVWTGRVVAGQTIQILVTQDADASEDVTSGNFRVLLDRRTA